MTEIPAEPVEPTPPASPTRSRRRLVIGIAVGLVVVVAAAVGVTFAINGLNAKAIALYTSKAEQYSVMAPGEAAQKHEDLVGAITTTTTHWTDGDVYYAVSSTDGEDLPPSQRGLFLNAALVAALKNAPGVSASSLESKAVTDAFLAEPDSITLSGEPAYQFPLTVEGAAAPVHVVFAGHGTKLYMLVYSDSDDSRDEDFVDSFTFLD